MFVRNYQSGERWVPGVIEDLTGPVSFRVKLSDGRVRCCHLDQVRTRSVSVPQEVTHEDLDVPVVEREPDLSPETSPLNQPRVPEPGPEPPDQEPVVENTAPKSPASAKVYPSRRRNTVNRYDPSWS